MHEGFPLCLRLIKEIHGILLSHGRGENKQPGEFRLAIPTVAKVIRELEALGIVQETTGKTRGKVYVYQEYLDILNDGIGF